MIPSVFALIVLTAGLIMIHFGVKDIETQLGNLKINPAGLGSTVTATTGGEPTTYEGQPVGGTGY